jgi:hypothetical protein
VSLSARRLILVVLIVLAFGVLTPALATATITPTLSATPSSHAAGSSVSLSTDIKFAPSSSDSPKDLTLSLPPGLLSNAAIDGGACLKATGPIPACDVGKGTATATATVVVPVKMNVSLTFYLVAPPKPGDLAGLDIEAGSPVNGPLGSPGEVSIRPADAGVDVAFKNIPNTATVMGLTVKTSVSELQTTLTGVRMPTSCPAKAAAITVTADSYNDASKKSTGAPLSVTGCNSLPFTPKFAVTAARDSADSGVALTTDITQPASPAQATDRAAVLTLPTTVFSPNVVAVLSGGILCPSVSSSCKAIGSASSTSPLYPRALTGTAYLIGSLSDITNIKLALVFPPPFALTLLGAVNTSQGTTTFTGLPDLPLTDLKVSLFGGPNSVFTATCNPASGTASSTLTTQNGDRTSTVAAPFTVSGCPAGGGGTGGGGTGGGGTGGGGTGGGGTGGGGTGGGGSPAPVPGRPHTSADTLTRFAHGHPVLRFTAAAGKNAPKLRAVTIVVPKGLGLARARRHHKGTSVSVTGAKVKSVRFSHGRIIITLRRPAAHFTVTVRGLSVTRTFARAVNHHRVKRRAIALITIDARGNRTLLAAVFAVRR